MSEHTKGPWRVNVANNGVERNIQTDDEWYVAVACVVPEVIGNVDANAHLIAAAPDMLEALERAAAAFNRMDGTYATRLDEHDQQTHSAVLAAIKKARGEK